jgi:O-antigen/teichoic acid export membrane protein
LAAGARGLAVTANGWVILPLVFAGPANAALAGWMQWYLLLFAVPCLLSLAACSWLQGVGRTGAFNVSRATVHVVNAAGFGLLWVAGDGLVWHFACALLVGNAATWLLATALGPRVLHEHARPSLDFARRMFNYGFRVQVGNWSNAANVRLDQLLLSLLATPASLGVYVVAVTYANVVLTLPGSAALVMLPQIVSEHRNGTAPACMARWYRRTLWTSASGAAAIAIAGIYLLPLLFGPGFEPAVPLLVFLVPATVLLGMNQILSTAFRGIDRPAVGSTAETLGLVVTVVSLVLLLPRYGMYGAAIASLAAYSASHAYLLLKALAVFGGDVRALCIPTRADADAVLRLLGTRTQAGALP